MSRLFYHVMQDNAGNLLFDVTGTMRLAGSGTLATIYGDAALTVILPNPMTNHPSFGSFKCYLGAGSYDFYMAKSGYTFETLTGVQGHGTMAQQNANAVAITGGTAIGLSEVRTTRLTLPQLAGNDLIAVYSDMVLAGQTGRYFLYLNGDVPSRLGGGLSLGGHLGVASAVPSAQRVEIQYDHAAVHGIKIRATNNDTGGALALLLSNVADGTVGYIACNATTTTYSTASDARLKHASTPLTGALDVVRRLRPITHLWRADDSRGYGFLADEVEDALPAGAGVITGARDAVDEVGNILPQMIDYGKLVPWLTAALHDALGALDTLTARVASLEQQLGV